LKGGKVSKGGIIGGTLSNKPEGQSVEGGRVVKEIGRAFRKTSRERYAVSWNLMRPRRRPEREGERRS